MIYIRSEHNKDEHRTPLVPNDIKKLNNYIVYVQSSENRIYSDEEYQNNGAIITNKLWYDPIFKDALIVGLKDLDNLDKLAGHSHVYFSHSYKNQLGSEKILSAFKNSSSIIYDFEYFINNNKRLISFGYYAGIAGGYLGLLQYITKKQYPGKNISNLEYCETINNSSLQNINICIIGSNGNCGEGVKYILDNLNLKYIQIQKGNDKSNLKNYDILYNCIKLSEESNEIWFDKNTVFTKPIIIVDISCDYTKENNPIKLYNKCTTWTEPVYSYNQYVDIIAIDNLPSLLPKDSSDYFSNIFTKLLLEKDKFGYWENNKNIFKLISQQI